MGRCRAPRPDGCANRAGRLARVGVEYVPGSFWSMYYDYVPDGSLGAETYPDGAEVRYEYDTAGRLVRQTFPARPGDATVFGYDTNAGDGQDGSEVVSIDQEWGPDIIHWARSISRDALGRPTEIRTYDDPAVRSNIQWRTDGRMESWEVRLTVGDRRRDARRSRAQLLGGRTPSLVTSATSGKTCREATSTMARIV